jgi:hypothetical protein
MIVFQGDRTTSRGIDDWIGTSSAPPMTTSRLSQPTSSSPRPGAQVALKLLPVVLFDHLRRAGDERSIPDAA